MPRRSAEEVLNIITPRGKGGQTAFSRRKVLKVTDESTISASELAWMKDYAAVLKAVSYSYRYISDTLMVQTGIVKKWFEDPEVQAKVVLVNEDIVSGAVGHLKHHSVDLIEMLMELARSTSDDAVKLRAITEALDRVGISKVNKSESVVNRTDRQEVGLSAEIFERMEGMPIKTQEELARLATEMEAVMEESKGAE